MPDRVLDCRVFFNDEGNAQNAYDHIKALMEHAVAHDIQVGSATQHSWVRLHDCHARVNEGDVSGCVTVEMFEVGGSPSGTEPGEYPVWQEWDGHNESLYQVGDRVQHNDQVWESTVSDNHWEPGVYGWVVV